MATIGDTFIYLTATTNVAAGGVVAPWSVGLFGGTGNFNIVTGVFTAPETGLYQFDAKFQTNIIQPVLYINGATGYQIPCTVSMTAGQTGAFIAPQASTIIGGSNPATGAPWSYMSINRVWNYATPTDGGVVYGLSDNNANGNVLLGHGISTGGTGNAIVGTTAGIALTTGSQNSLFGTNAGAALITGGTNTAIGLNALSGNTGGVGNTCIGSNAGKSYLLNNIVCVGNLAGASLTTGNQNTLIGTSAGTALTTGIQNTVVGNAALLGTTGSNFNTAIGLAALTAYIDSGSSNNTAVGWESSTALKTGVQNTTLGTRSMVGCTGGSFNTCLGESAGLNFTTASGTTHVGALSGINMSSSINNVIVGEGGGNGYTGTATNNLALGWGSGSTGGNISNEIYLGNTSSTTLLCPAAVTAVTGAALGINPSTFQIGELQPEAFSVILTQDFTSGVTGFNGMTGLTGSLNTSTFPNVDPSLVYDNIHYGSMNYTTGVFTVGITGTYEITRSLILTSGTANTSRLPSFQINGAGLVFIINSLNTNLMIYSSGLLKLKTGDTIASGIDYPLGSGLAIIISAANSSSSITYPGMVWGMSLIR